MALRVPLCLALAQRVAASPQTSRPTHSTPLTRPEDGQGAVPVQPGQRRPVQLLQAAGGHGPLEGLKQWLYDDAELHSTWVKEKEARRTACGRLLVER